MIHRSSKFPHCGLFPLFGLCILLVLLSAITAQGATYYVATTGSDSNPGTSDRPWRNPQRCAAPPITAGDTCIVRNGTYTDEDGNGLVVYISLSSAAGTSSQPITIKSETPLGAKLIVPSIKNGLNAGVYVGRPYYIIEGFDISGGTRADTSVIYSGISFLESAKGGIARSNSIHHIGRAVCSNSGYGFTGIYSQQTSNLLIERNRLYSIGRLRNGENGCSTTIWQHDHGVYIRGGSYITVRRNVFYDTNRGYPIHVYGMTVSNLNIDNNTLSDGSPTGQPYGQIMLGSTINDSYIRNNISYGAQRGMINVYNLSSFNLNATYNLSDTLIRATSAASGVTLASNFERTSPGLVSASTNDFRLTSSSIALNRGTTSGVLPVSDGLPDIGCYEYSEQNNTSSPLTPAGVSAQ